MHAPHAQFTSQAKVFNERLTINLLWSADIKTTGYFYVIYRALCMCKALLATIVPPTWVDPNKELVVNHAADQRRCFAVGSRNGRNLYWKILRL